MADKRIVRKSGPCRRRLMKTAELAELMALGEADEIETHQESSCCDSHPSLSPSPSRAQPRAMKVRQVSDLRAMLENTPPNAKSVAEDTDKASSVSKKLGGYGPIAESISHRQTGITRKTNVSSSVLKKLGEDGPNAQSIFHRQNGITRMTGMKPMTIVGRAA